MTMSPFAPRMRRESPSKLALPVTHDIAFDSRFVRGANDDNGLQTRGLGFFLLVFPLLGLPRLA